MGWNHVNENGWECFATARNEAREGGLMRLYPFDEWLIDEGPERPDLRDFMDAHEQIASPQDDIKELMEAADTEGLYVAMFHGDEVIGISMEWVWGNMGGERRLGEIVWCVQNLFR